MTNDNKAIQIITTQIQENQVIQLPAVEQIREKQNKKKPTLTKEKK